MLEVLKNGEWEGAPIKTDEEYGFISIAYFLPCGEVTEREIYCKWIYGELEPGEYRIGKSVHDFVETGNYDRYMIYAQFIIN